MAKFHISTPGGYEVEVTANTQEEAIQTARENWQTMPRIIAKQAGDVRVFERPNGQRYVVTPEYSTTDPERIAAILENISRNQPAGEAVKTAIDESLIAQYPLSARASEYVKGVPFVGSYADELVGALAGPEAGAGTRAIQAAMERQRPGQTAALNLAGGATAALGAAAAAPQMLASGTQAVLGQGTRLAQAARGMLGGALAGTIEGGIYGAGEGTTAAERLSEAARGAAFGGFTGGVMGAATPYVKAGVENIIGRIKQSDVYTIAQTFNISQKAAQVIKNTFEMGGGLQDAIQRLRRAGDSAMIADANEATQALLDATAASGAAAARAAREPIEARMTEQAAKMDVGLTGLLGRPAEGPQTAVSEIMQASREPRKSAYSAAYETPINYASPEGQAIEAVLARVDPDIMQQAIREANAEMADLGFSNQQILADIADDGTIVFREMPNVRQLDELKRALDTISKNSKRQEGIITVETAASRRYRRQANDLRDALVAATGGSDGVYAKALNIGGDTIAEREAFFLGERLTRPSTRVEDVMLELGRNPSLAALEAAKRGLRTHIEEVVGNVKRIPSDPNIDARQALATLRELGSENAREKIRRLMGDEAEQVFRLLDEASNAAETRAAMAANSRTAVRQAIQGDVADLTQKGIIGQAASGEAVNTTKALIQAVTGQTAAYDAAQRQKIYLDIARALTAKRGREAEAALRILDAAMQGQALTDQQTTALAQMIAGSLFGVATSQTGRAIMPESNR